MQWVVDVDGDMVTVKPAPSYLIERKRLTEKTERAGKKLYDWPVHLAEKEWVNLESFERAWVWAVYKSGLPFDPELARASFRWAADERVELRIPIAGTPNPFA